MYKEDEKLMVYQVQGSDDYSKGSFFHLRSSLTQHSVPADIPFLMIILTTWVLMPVTMKTPLSPKKASVVANSSLLARAISNFWASFSLGLQQDHIIFQYTMVHLLP